MNRTTKRVVLVAAGLILCVASMAHAHHSFAGEYDANRPVTLLGQITRVDLMNPHAWLYLEVKDADGKAAKWSVEMAPPNNLVRRGVTEATLAIGATVTIDGYRAKDGSLTVSGRQIKTADGRTLLIGSNSGTPADIN